MLAPPGLPAPSPECLILGTGFGGVYTLRRMVGLLKKGEVDVTLIGEDNLFAFSPLLHEVATGALEPRHVALPVRRLPRRDLFSFVQTRIEQVDLVEPEECAPPRRLSTTTIWCWPWAASGTCPG